MTALVLEKPQLSPRPQFVRFNLRLPVALSRAQPTFVDPDFLSPENRWALEPLAELRRADPHAFRILPCTGPAPAGLVAAKAGRSQAARALALKFKDSPLVRRLGEEGYLLESDERGVRLSAESARGLFWAAHALRRLVKRRGDRLILPACKIADAPVLPLRGISVPAHGPEMLPLLRRLISEVMPLWKANTLVLGVNYRFQYRSHPEVVEDKALSREDARNLARLCRAHGVRLIPLLNCLGHQSWKTRVTHGLLRAYPEFDETPNKTELKYCRSWCPSDGRVYLIVNDLLDELLEAFEADAVHVGMDEVFELGECPKCRRKTPAALFAKAAQDLHRHIVGRRRRRMWLWGDRLIDGRKTPYNDMNGACNGTHPALKMLPKDVLLCDWHYHLHDSYPSTTRFHRAGFDYVTCSWRKPEATRALMTWAAQHGGTHWRGHLGTVWDNAEGTLAALLKDDAGRDGAADAFRLGMEFAWRGDVKARKQGCGDDR
jgi:hypothetical protein